MYIPNTSHFREPTNEESNDKIKPPSENQNHKEDKAQPPSQTRAPSQERTTQPIRNFTQKLKHRSCIKTYQVVLAKTFIITKDFMDGRLKSISRF